MMKSLAEKIKNCFMIFYYLQTTGLNYDFSKVRRMCKAPMNDQCVLYYR